MWDAILWIVQKGTNQYFFTFADNNWIVLLITLKGLKIVASRTENTLDDSLYELFKYLFGEIRGAGKRAVTGVATGTVKIGKAVADKTWDKNDPANMAANH